MSEMIEQVAKAVEAELWEESPKHIWAERIARAAMAAMREPTQQMRLAGIAEWSRPDPTPEHESTLVFNAIWRSMIDAALNEKSPAAVRPPG